MDILEARLAYHRAVWAGHLSRPLPASRDQVHAELLQTLDCIAGGMRYIDELYGVEPEPEVKETRRPLQEEAWCSPHQCHPNECFEIHYPHAHRKEPDADQ